jgi:hypothetical protein
MISVPNARQVALDLISSVLRRKRPLDDAIEDNPDMAALSVRDRAFAPRDRAAVVPAYAAACRGRDQCRYRPQPRVPVT